MNFASFLVLHFSTVTTETWNFQIWDFQMIEREIIVLDICLHLLLSISDFVLIICYIRLFLNRKANIFSNLSTILFFFKIATKLTLKITHPLLLFSVVKKWKTKNYHFILRQLFLHLWFIFSMMFLILNVSSFLIANVN